MWDITMVKRRTRPEADETVPPPSSVTRGDDAAERVRASLRALGCEQLHARAHGDHIVIGRGRRARGRDSFARLTALGRDAFGIAFRTRDGGWEPMLLVDTLDAIVSGLIAAFGASHADS